MLLWIDLKKFVVENLTKNVTNCHKFCGFQNDFKSSYGFCFYVLRFFKNLKCFLNSKLISENFLKLKIRHIE